MHTPKISVVMPVMNEERYIRASIDSILNQTFSDFEFLIIDDGSTDSTPAILAEYSARDDRIRILRNETNISVPESINRGLREARGEYIARQDGDDIAEPDRLKKQVRFLECNSDHVLVGGGYRTIDSEGRFLKIDAGGLDHAAFSWTSIFRPPLVHSTAVFPREVVVKNDVYFDRAFDGAADFEFWHRLLQFGRGARLDGVLVSYRMHEHNVSTRKAEKQRTAMQRAGVVNARRRFPDVPLEKIEALFEYLIPVSNTGRDCFPAALKTMRLLESKFLDAAALSTNETQQIRNLASRWLAAAALDHQQDRSLALGRLLWRDWKNLPNYVSETAGFFSRRANAVIRQEGLRS